MKRFLSFLVLLLFAAPMICPAKEIMSEYRGIKLGTKQEEVHQKLGKPINSSESEEEFDLGSGNSMRVHYDGQKAVHTIVLYFYSNDEKVPKFENVIGDAKVERTDSGPARAKLVDNEGKFSITMSQTGGGAPMTIIMIKKL